MIALILRFRFLWLLLMGLIVGERVVETAFAQEPCEIRIVDRSNGWPVPLVQLTTTHQVTFVSDNDGVIAFDLPELMGVQTWFSVQGHGYSVPADGFGMRGVRLTPVAGERLTVSVDRELPAKRLGRVTGGGLFGESQRFGRFQDWTESGRLGCDSVQTAVHNGKLHWGWGDTNLPGYPLGLFQMTGATTGLRPVSNWKPPLQLKYDLFRDDQGKPTNVAQVPGSGPTWLGGYASIRDRQGVSRLGATYAKIQPPLSTYELGLCVWDESQERFLPHRILWNKERDGGKAPSAPNGHMVRWTDADGQTWLLFGDPFPEWKCQDRFEAWEDPDQWEKLEPQTSVTTADGKEIRPHRGSIAYRPFRQRWVCIFCQFYGEASELGELWYCEADSPLGPWENAIQVVTHDHYTFYNPHLHPELVDGKSPVLLFEATYTKTFSSTQTSTPRHDYNQVMYRLDLDQLPFSEDGDRPSK